MEFGEYELLEIAQALDQRIWFIIDDLKGAVRVLLKADPKSGRIAIDDACKAIAELATETLDEAA
jgi:hypothetical protein